MVGRPFSSSYYESPVRHYAHTVNERITSLSAPNHDVTPADADLYEYCLSSPGNYIDPMGLESHMSDVLDGSCECTCSDAIAQAVGTFFLRKCLAYCTASHNQDAAQMAACTFFCTAANKKGGCIALEQLCKVAKPKTSLELCLAIYTTVCPGR